MRRTIAVLGFVSILASAAFSFTVLPNGTSRAATAHEATFLIPATDGYGVADCLSSGSECGKVVANAWCEAQGYTQAANFGLAAAEDATGTVGAASSRNDRPISITCINS
jgi:hypothetical protein